MWPDYRIIVSMTTHSGRNGTLQPTIDSLLKQTLKPDEIRVYYVDGVNQLPGNVTCIKSDDFGPITKISAVFDNTLRDDDLVLSVDDDVIVHRNAIRMLADASSVYPNDAIGFSGWNINLDTPKVYDWPNGPCVVDVLQGYSVVAYRKRFFDASILDFPAEFRNVDDVVISGYLSKRRVTRRKIDRKGLRVVLYDHSREGLHTNSNFHSLNRQAAITLFGR